MGCDVSKKIRVGWDDLFQSTHPSGVRPAVKTCCRTYQHYFNPRTPVGCDLALIAEYQRDKNFNPRTPVGCDRRTGCYRDVSCNFNPRTPVGCDPCSVTIRSACAIFQSTHPSGVRREVATPCCSILYFNPRTPVGCDDRSTTTVWSPVYFNPRTPVGCDAFGQADLLHPIISIHAPQWGATCSDLGTMGRKPYFNPRTPVGCDLRELATQTHLLEFQSTHPSGVRLREWA